MAAYRLNFTIKLMVVDDHGGAVAEWVRALACTGGGTVRLRVRIPLRTTSLRNFGNERYNEL